MFNYLPVVPKITNNDYLIRQEAPGRTLRHEIMEVVCLQQAYVYTGLEMLASRLAHTFRTFVHR
jgi:hypothetical protein